MMRRIDFTGFVLVASLAVIALGGGAALVHYRLFSLSELAAFLLVGFAFLAVGLPSQSGATPRNTNVHGAARPASEAEADAAARSGTKLASLDNRTFPD